MAVTKEEFRSGYGKLVAKIWSDKNELEKLREAPTRVLEQFGIAVPARTSIRVVEVVPTGKGSFVERDPDDVRSEPAGLRLGDVPGEARQHDPVARRRSREGVRHPSTSFRAGSMPRAENGGCFSISKPVRVRNGRYADGIG